MSPTWRLTAVLLAAGCCPLLAGQACAEDGYQLGQGYNLGPINFAGYSNLVGSLPDHTREKSLQLSDLSLYVSGHLGQLINPFVDAEFTNFRFVNTKSRQNLGDGAVVLERLYNDSLVTDSLTVRLGKILSPVGEWNVIHAAPLVPATMRPAVTYQNFSEYATGASLLYSDPTLWIPDTQVYWQPSGQFSDRPSSVQPNHYDSVVGGHVSLPLGLLDKVGISYQRARNELGIGQTLLGIDGRYTIGNLTIQGEGTYLDVAHSTSSLFHDLEWGCYTAVTYRMTGDLSVHAWYEGFAERSQVSAAQDFLFGLDWKPHPAITLRLEYLINVGGPPVNPTGVLGSWSVLF